MRIYLPKDQYVESLYQTKNWMVAARHVSLKMAESAAPGREEHLFSVAALVETSLNFVSDVMKSMRRFGSHHLFVQNLGLPSGALWSLSSGRELRGGRGDLSCSNEIGDREGIHRAKARLVVGSFAFSAALTNLAGRVATASRLLPFLSDSCLGINSFLNFGVAGLGVVRCHRFRGRLDHYFKKQGESEPKRVENALNFLVELLGTDSQEFVPKEKLLKLIEVKVKYLKRRTSMRSVQKLIDRIGPILKNINDPGTLAEGKALIDEIRSDNKWKEFLFVIGALSSSIGLLGLGLACPVVSGVSSALYLLTTIYFLALQVLK